jgi:hypothetical protein
MNHFRLFAFSLLIACSTLALAAPPATVPPTTTALAADSMTVRQELTTTLRSLPPEVGMILKLDPTLFGNHDYLASYPALAAFVAEHPGVAHNPHFYLENVSVRSSTGLLAPGDRRRHRHKE